jgi:fatty acid desaturase
MLSARHKTVVHGSMKTDLIAAQALIDARLHLGFHLIHRHCSAMSPSDSLERFQRIILADVPVFGAETTDTALFQTTPVLSKNSDTTTSKTTRASRAASDVWEGSRTVTEALLSSRSERPRRCLASTRRAYKAAMMWVSTASASLAPSASPFSKSAPSWPIVLVTWARQRMRTPADCAKA